ncbi:hypothetical protein PLESTB_000554400 [Pleodorina starrii]|uniref:histone deacetylase n=1 Tax=Pleodorina starrii TaxID=330485 RepID=A0A9W6F168_9CHLO|nr:hypothetical protein PLESTB_000554400 [Pleodorina starrii]GLC74522.1 hypothetical protein PLESTF_001523200 [Pleodorina starrii]
MNQFANASEASGAVDSLQADLQRFSVGAAESAAAAILDDDLQEDTTSSSSSESSVGLPAELHPADGTRGGPLETLAPTESLPNDAPVGLLYDQSMEQHFGPDHFERPARIIALHATLQDQGLMGRCWQLVPRLATDEELLLAHSEEHIRKVDSMFSELYPDRPEQLAEAEYCYADGRMGDVYICTGTARAARMAAGCCVQAVQSVLSGSVSRAMAVVRPPGHHAECERAMGFCFFNNVAVAALEALRQPGVRRVAVLDWDVHHGNGIQNLLLQRPDALYISLHRDPKRFYPYTSGFLNEAGEGAGTGFNVNLPWLKKGMGDGDYLAAFSLIVEPILESYEPDLVIVAAGFDAADGDPLGGCKLSPEGYGWMTERLLRFAGGKLVLALEGGYNNRVTSWCAAACVRALLEGRASPPLPADKEHLWPSEAHNSLKLVYEFQRQHWPVLRSRSWTEAWEAHLKDVHRMLGVNVRSKRSSAGGISGSGSGTCGGNATAVSGGGAVGAAAAAATPRVAAAAAEAPSSSGRGPPAEGSGRRSSGSSAAGSGPPPQSLQDAFKARKAARETAAAVAVAATSAVSVATAAAAGTPAAAAAACAASALSSSAAAAVAVAGVAADRDAAALAEPAPPPPELQRTAVGETAAAEARQSSSDCATGCSNELLTFDDSADNNASSSVSSGNVPTHGSVRASGSKGEASGELVDEAACCDGSYNGGGATAAANGRCGGNGGGGCGGGSCDGLSNRS